MTFKTHLTISLFILLIALIPFSFFIGRYVGYIDGVFDSPGDCAESEGAYLTLQRTAGVNLFGTLSDTQIEPVLDEPIKGSANVSEPTVKELKFLIDDYVDYYQIDPSVKQLAKDIIQCESSWRVEAYNPMDAGSPSIGLAQFKVATFNQWKKYFGLFDHDINNPEHQVQLLVLMLGARKQGNWLNCYNKTL